MIRSMTAFASAEADTPLGPVTCEVRTVNHRYLEVTPRLPEELRAMEPLLRERVAAHLSRGKVDISLKLRGEAKNGQRLRLNESLVDDLAEVADVMHKRFPGFSVTFIDLLRYPGVLQQPDIDQQALAQMLTRLLDAALAELGAARQREGAKLAALIEQRVEGVARIVAQVRTWLPEIRDALRTRLKQRLADLKVPVEPGRLEQELVLQLGRADVDEELDRLDAHVGEARRVLGLDEAVGRRLDFLMQEFNREANTLGSKSVDPRTTQASVELKVLIEQAREQVQNIE